MADGTKAGALSPFGKQAASIARRKEQVVSFRKNAGARFEPDGEQQAVLWEALMACFKAGATLTLSCTSRGDAMGLRIWRPESPVIQDYLTNEDDWSEWLEFLKTQLAIL